MAGREPTKMDMERMKRAVSYVTAYDLGVKECDFKDFIALVNEEDEPLALVQTLAQFSWLLLKSMEASGVSKEQVLSWYGMQFAVSSEKLDE
jgi:hypothetical protein